MKIKNALVEYSIDDIEMNESIIIETENSLLKTKNVVLPALIANGKLLRLYPDFTKPLKPGIQDSKHFCTINQ
jgi:hypothetical protein